MRYAFIRAHASEYATTSLCRVLQVKRASYYAWVKRGISRRAQRTAALTTAVEVAFRASGGRYGSPRVQEELRATGQRHSRKRIARIMQLHGWRAQAPRRFRRTTDSRHDHPIAPNVLARRFDAPEYQQPNRAWASDFTFIATHEGWLYLAIVLDLASRRVVGWAMRATMDTTLATDALTMAVTQRQPAPGLLHHSDRGVQYAAQEYRTLLAQHGMVASMSRRGNCWDNAVAESFFATLRRELEGPRTWPTRDAARGAIFDFIERWYNRQRRHSRLGYQCPVAYEAALDAAA
jgi:transposase InsO family protein